MSKRTYATNTLTEARLALRQLFDDTTLTIAERAEAQHKLVERFWQIHQQTTGHEPPWWTWRWG
jgi:hypothetical protein